MQRLLDAAQHIHAEWVCFSLSNELGYTVTAGELYYSPRLQ
jgi:hypothetical protein